MSINKHSILRLISLFFILIFLLINGLFWIALEHFAREYGAQQQQHHLHFVLHEQMLINHKPFLLPPPPPPPPIFVSLTSSSLIPIWIVFITIDILILAFFAYLRKKLTPLHRLKKSITQYKEGDQTLNIVLKGKDEISQIAEEFNTVLQKIAAMKEARSLFLRNILHELKTPIMKGALTADCLSPSVEQERLNRIFNRMDYLLGEFSKMEQFSSGQWRLNLQEYRFVDILDHTCDILLCDKKALTIKGEDSSLIVRVDFELFAIALKNLIDNALKYSETKPILTILSHSIEICNIGDPLSNENQQFSKPFNRTYEGSQSGLGLGLYITDSILKKHGFSLRYRYLNGLNCFQIRLGSAQT